MIITMITLLGRGIKVIGTTFGECLNYKSGLRILILPPEVPFFVVRKQSLLPKVPIFEKSGLEFNFPSKSKCPSLNFEIWVLGANLTEP